jgi:hypothetical protein
LERQTSAHPFIDPDNGLAQPEDSPHHTAQCFRLTAFDRSFAQQQVLFAFQASNRAGCRKGMAAQAPTA